MQSHRRVISLAVVASFGCGHAPAPNAVPRAREVPSVRFEARSGPLGELPHGGPPWILEPVGLPAISWQGDEVIAAERGYSGMGAGPTLGLVTLSVASGTERSREWILGVDEFRGAGAALRPEDAFARLALRIAARTEEANARLSSYGDSMRECAVDPPPLSAQPFCSMPVQRVRCKEKSWIFRTSELELSAADASTSRRFPEWKPPRYEAPWMPGGEMPVATCLGRVYVDPQEKVLAVEVWYACQLGGDWCVVEPNWKTVALYR